MEIPYQELSSETLQQIIEEFVLREGTDYGFGNEGESSQNEISLRLEVKVSQVRKQLESGLVCVVFDPDTETCNIVRK